MRDEHETGVAPRRVPGAGLRALAAAPPSRATAAALLAPVLAALAACGTGSGGPRAGPEGVPAIGLERVASIGCSDCEGPRQLDVFALAVDPGGRIWTLDRYEPIVRVFARDGTVLEAVGQRGEGPGEFTGAGADVFVPGLAVYPLEGGRAWVHRRAPAGLMEFDVDAGYVGDVEIDWPPSRIPRSVTWDPRNRRAWITAVALPRANATPGDRVAIYRLEVGAPGDGRSRAGPLPVEVKEMEIDAAILPRSEDGPGTPNRGFPIAVAPDGTLAIGDPLNYEVTRIEPGGSVRGGFGRDVPRPPKGEERLRREREGATRRGRPSAEVPEVLPHFGPDALDFDSAGRLWVGTYRRAGGGSIFDVFARDGTFLGEVVLPELLQEDGLSSFAVSGGHLVAVVVGPAGNDRIGVWRVVDGGSGGE